MKPIALDQKQRKEIEKRRRQTHDKRVYARLSAVLWVAEGRTRTEVAALLDISLRQLGDWLRIFRNKGLEELTTLHYYGDPGKLTPHQVQQLKDEVAKGRFHSSRQIRDWLESTWGVKYSSSGVKDLLYRIGVSYHTVSGFLWKADPEKQKQFVRKVRRHRREVKRAGRLEPAVITSMRVIRSGGWIWYSIVGCWWGNASWSAWAVDGIVSTSSAPTARTTTSISTFG